MAAAVLFRLRPAGPWRFGPSDGGANRVDSLFRSDRLWSALTVAAQQLGFVEEWLEATAKSAEPVLACSSLFPFQGEVAYVTPPSTLWPPPAAQLATPSPVFLTKVRWSAARFVPVSLVDTILSGGRVLADQWTPDPESGCLLRRDRPSTAPFRSALRVGAAVDRMTGVSGAPHGFACVEFEAGAGLWGVLQYASDDAQTKWNQRVRGMFRLLADTGLGGRRSAGWGQIAALEFEEDSWPARILPKATRLPVTADSVDGQHWLLSLYAPALTDSVQWEGGDYRVVERGGFRGKTTRFVSEGSVLAAVRMPLGAAVDVADEASPHPVYRFGIALALRLPERPTVQAESAPSIVEDAMPVESCAAAAEEPAVIEPHQEAQAEEAPSADAGVTEPETVNADPEPREDGSAQPDLEESDREL